MQAAQEMFWRLKGWKRKRNELSWVIFVSVSEVIAINNSADCPIHLFNPLKVFQLRRGIVVNQKKSGAWICFCNPKPKSFWCLFFGLGLYVWHLLAFLLLISMSYSVLRAHQRFSVTFSFLVSYQVIRGGLLQGVGVFLKKGSISVSFFRWSTWCDGKDFVTQF